ncbi:MAG: hypothetical protein ACXAD7_04750 [Candidatus Kariarchaeaceae archaeon]|jgi:hypothetical protein
MSQIGNNLVLSSYEQIFLGVYLIIHGLIHVVFLIHIHDKQNNSFVGWSGKSWLLDRVANRRLINLIGKLIWILIVILFVLGGLAVFKVFATDFAIRLIIVASIIATLAFIVFYDGLAPTPLHWILGVAVNVVLIIFIAFWRSNVTLLVAILILIWLYGMFIHTKIIPQGEIVEDNMKTQ